MNRELRRLQEREERTKKKQGRRTPAVAGQPKRQRVGLRQFIREVRQELNKAAWPARTTLVTYVVVAMITTGALTAYTSALDFAFNKAFIDLLLR